MDRSLQIPLVVSTLPPCGQETWRLLRKQRRCSKNYKEMIENSERPVTKEEKREERSLLRSDEIRVKTN